MADEIIVQSSDGESLSVDIREESLDVSITDEIISHQTVEETKLIQPVEETRVVHTVEETNQVSVAHETVMLSEPDEIVFRIESPLGGAAIVSQHRTPEEDLPTTGAKATVDSVAIGRFRAVKWLVVLSEAGGGRFMSFEVRALHDGSTVHNTQYGFLGDNLNYDLDIDIVDGFLDMVVTSLEPNPLEVSVVRIPVM